MTPRIPSVLTVERKYETDGQTSTGPPTDLGGNFYLVFGEEKDLSRKGS